MTHGEYEATSPQVGGSGSVQGVQVCSRERVRKEDPRVRTDNARGILSMQYMREMHARDMRARRDGIKLHTTVPDFCQRTNGSVAQHRVDTTSTIYAVVYMK